MNTPKSNSSDDTIEKSLTKGMTGAYIKPVIMYVPFVASAAGLFWVGAANKELTFTQASIMVIAAMILVLPWLSSIKLSKDGIEVQVAEAAKEIISALSSFSDATNAIANKINLSSNTEKSASSSAIVRTLSSSFPSNILDTPDSDIVTSMQEGNEHLQKASNILSSLSRAS